LAEIRKDHGEYPLVLPSGVIKSVIFGIVMGLSSCHYGLSVKGGAPGVGKAVNATVVTSAAGIFVVDYFVSFTLN